MADRFRIVPLGSLSRAGFSCGVAALDRYFAEQITQDIRRRVTNCFVALDADNMIAGFYTFAATGLPLIDLPPEQAKRLPRYPLLPAALVGRLAVDIRFRGQGLGSTLLADAGVRALAADPAIFALVVDAKDAQAAAFYLHFGFQPLLSRPQGLFLPLATFAKTMR